ncbi:patatin-like phospholipase family protein [Alsobacter sp. SYSU M60028]|uniref:Patatin-like phospholipase family protein n=1 Tax=Alsobacter ponti TaxID=2962936 RepID=A0ABT1LDD5_9HYPH|nr:patatin-like phospholipase family protein [Alsobacter ponti]MCP8939526.1 patatin-like phospholipase family protein [Alsobacter ponti]
MTHIDQPLRRAGYHPVGGADSQRLDAPSASTTSEGGRTRGGAEVRARSGAVSGGRDSAGPAGVRTAEARSSQSADKTAWRSARPNPGGGLPIIRRHDDGRVTVIRHAPPIREGNVAGGGGKGNALPGVLEAWEKAGVGETMKDVYGASIGSLTAACWACGMSAEEFRQLAATSDIAGMIGVNASGITVALKSLGQGGAGYKAIAFENFVRGCLRDTALSRIDARETTGPAFTAEQKAFVDDLRARLAGGEGVTFGDLQRLSAFVPGIKNLHVTGTIVNERAHGRTLAPQEFLFDAGSTPELDVARAIHASAALPPVFESVRIDVRGRGELTFRDGGIRNNLPTSDNTEFRPKLGGLPDGQRSVVDFEDENLDRMLAGDATMRPNGANAENLIAGAKFDRGIYRKNLFLAGDPQSVFQVGLKLPHKDYSGLAGTLALRMDYADQQALIAMAEQGMTRQMERQLAPRTTTLPNLSAALNALTREELTNLAMSGDKAAQEIDAFRDSVSSILDEIDVAVAELGGAASQADLRRELQPGGRLSGLLAQLDRASAGDPERLAYIAREAHRDYPDGAGAALGALGRAGGAFNSPAMASMARMSNDIAGQELAFKLLKGDGPLIRKLYRQGDGSGGKLLAKVAVDLRDAVTADQVKQALSYAIDHFATKSDRTGRHQHAAFAAKLKDMIAKAGI